MDEGFDSEKNITVDDLAAMIAAHFLRLEKRMDRFEATMATVVTKAELKAFRQEVNDRFDAFENKVNKRMLAFFDK